MSSLDDRQNAFENKYKHDEELKFRVNARRAKLFGLWVGEQIGLPVDEAYALGKSMVQLQLEKQGASHLIDETESLLQKAGKGLTRHTLEAQLENLGIKAKDQIMQEGEKRAT
jgi:hypothetical protein